MCILLATYRTSTRFVCHIVCVCTDIYTSVYWFSPRVDASGGADGLRTTAVVVVVVVTRSARRHRHRRRFRDVKKKKVIIIKVKGWKRRKISVHVKTRFVIPTYLLLNFIYDTRHSCCMCIYFTDSRIIVQTTYFLNNMV